MAAYTMTLDETSQRFDLDIVVVDIRSLPSTYLSSISQSSQVRRRSSFHPWMTTAFAGHDAACEGSGIEEALLPFPPPGIRSHERRGPQVAFDPAIRIRYHVPGRTVGDDPAVPEQQDTVRVSQCKVHIVSDQ